MFIKTIRKHVEQRKPNVVKFRTTARISGIQMSANIRKITNARPISFRLLTLGSPILRFAHTCGRTVYNELTHTYTKLRKDTASRKEDARGSTNRSFRTAGNANETSRGYS